MKISTNRVWTVWKRGCCAAMSVLLAAQMVPPSALAANIEADASQQTITQYVNQEDGKTKTIYWTQGVTPPKMGGENSDFVRTESTVGGETYVEYIAPFAAGNGWYDINKSESLENDANLCFAAAASNTLHWWLAQNREYVDSYLSILQQTDSEKAAKLQSLRVDAQEQTGSPIYKIFVDQFAKRQEGYWTDILQDQFLNGYKPKANGGVNDEDWDGPMLIANGPDPKGGFFYDVLKAKRLTRRSYYDAGYDPISKELKEHLMNGEIVLLSYAMGQAKSHVVTVWGAEYDQNGKLSAVYISDSDDAQQQGMVRYGVYRTGRGQAILSNRTNGGGTTLIESLQILSLGTQQWKQYLGIEKRALHLRWDHTKLTYNGNEQSPTVSAADIQAGDDVRLDVTGGAVNAGTHTANASLAGKDERKYEISGSNTIQYTIQPAPATVQVTADVQNHDVSLTAAVSGLNGETLTGEVLFAKDGAAVGAVSLQNNSAAFTYNESEAGEHSFTATYIPAAGSNYQQSISAPQKVDVAKQNQAALTIGNVGPKVYGDAPFDLRVSGGSTNGTVTYTSSDPTVLRIDGSQAVICGAGTAILTATMEGNTFYNSVTATLAVTVDKAPAPSITYPAASAITYGQKLSASVLNGGSTEYGGFAWSNPDGVPNAGAASAEIRFTPNEQTIRNYKTITDCSHTVNVTVHQATPNITVRVENLETTESIHTILLSAAVSNAGMGDTPSGTVTFYDCTGSGETAIGSAEALQNGGASLVWKDAAEQQYCIKAVYSGDSNYSGTEGKTNVDLRKAYAIMLTTNGHGRAAASVDQAPAGTVVTLTATPDSGYQLKDWEVISEEVQVKNHQFTMPAKDVSIKAIFAETPVSSGGGSGGGGGASDPLPDEPTPPEIEQPQSPAFADVPADAYYADAVKWAVEKKITSGMSETMFAPQASCTRAQMVTFLWRANGSPVVNFAMNFADVPQNAYYAEAVRWAASEQIVSGTLAGTFSPDDVVTRGQAVTLLYRTAGSPAVSGSSFDDIAEGTYYADAVAWAAENGVTTGVSDKAFHPADACNRGQIVSFLYRSAQ